MFHLGTSLRAQVAKLNARRRALFARAPRSYLLLVMVVGGANVALASTNTQVAQLTILPSPPSQNQPQYFAVDDTQLSAPPPRRGRYPTDATK